MSLYTLKFKTSRHTFSSTKKFFNQNTLLNTATIIALHCLFHLSTFHQTTGTPLPTHIINNYDLDEVQDKWLQGNDAYEEYQGTRDINTDLKQYLDQLENDESLELYNTETRNVRTKRFTMEFNGMQVSYPQYMRLVALQEKVVKLEMMINKLNSKYPAELLKDLPQYQRLIKLYDSLAPLLPESNMTDLRSQGFDELLTPAEEIAKRSSMSVDFMGMQVSYPQYLRLVQLQAKVVKLDKLMRKMLETRTLEQLQNIPKWNTLVALHHSLRKMLPKDYVLTQETFADAKRDAGRERNRVLGEEHFQGRFSKRSMGTTKFNGVQMSYPQYWKLMELQKKVMKLDSVMKTIAEKINDPKLLEKNPRWNELMGLRRSLKQLMPEKVAKRSPTMNFNGAQVSLPQYQHLVALQRKIMKLDSAMQKISEKSNQDALKLNPKWKALVEMRRSLMQLIPNEKGSEL